MRQVRQFLVQVRPWRLVLALALALAIAIGFVAVNGQYEKTMRRMEGDTLLHSEEYGPNWTYYMGGARGTPIAAKAIYSEYGFFESLEYPLAEGQAIGYSSVLNSVIEDAKLVLPCDMGALVVFLDDQVLYTDLPGQPATPDHWPQLEPGLYEDYPHGASRIITVTLPRNYTGRTLTIVEYVASEAMPYWSPMTPVVENENAEQTLYMAWAAPAFVLAGMLAAGLLLLGLLFCYQLLVGKPNWALLLPMAFLAIWATTYAEVPDEFGFKSTWSVILFSLAYVAADDLLLAYLACKLKGRGRYGVFALAAGQLCLAVGIAVYRWVAWHEPGYIVSRTEWILGLPQLAGFVLATVLAFREWRRDNRVMGVYCRLFIAFAGLAVVMVPVAWLGIPALWEYYLGIFYSFFEFFNLAPLLELLSTFMILGILVISLYEFISQQIERNTTLQTLELKNRLALENYETIRSAIQQTNLAQHELRNHTTALQALLDQQDYARAGEYLRQWTGQGNQLAPAQYGDNQLVSAIVQNRMGIAMGLGIKADCTVVAPPELPVPDAELCSLLLNMLDNAIEACARLPAEKRWLRLRVHWQDEMLAVSCQNAWDGRLKTGMDGGLSSTKTDNALHGYGLTAMRTVAEKYGSLLDISYDEAAFTVQTCLQPQ
ncbi:GHKL domain-containing protein [Ruminococcaceae bacterium OttesenSCG-928-D13]|nr:GHKL domain-containing protein [Ruminococcaceae bacterium OttesenSCG-928-D13]